MPIEVSQRLLLAWLKHCIGYLCAALYTTQHANVQMLSIYHSTQREIVNHKKALLPVSGSICPWHITATIGYGHTRSIGAGSEQQQRIDFLTATVISSLFLFRFTLLKTNHILLTSRILSFSHVDMSCLLTLKKCFMYERFICKSTEVFIIRINYDNCREQILEQPA